MTIENEHLYLQSRYDFPLYPNLSVDIFLQSLVEAKGDESIAVILSGRGSDGLKGSMMIKKRGGMVIVQTPQSCDYSLMPLSTIQTGSVDYELLPEEMPNVILKHINRWLNKGRDNGKY